MQLRDADTCPSTRRRALLRAHRLYSLRLYRWVSFNANRNHGRALFPRKGIVVLPFGPKRNRGRVSSPPLSREQESWSREHE